VYNIRSATLQDIDTICSLMCDSVCELCKDFYTKSELDAFLSNFPKRVYYNELLSDRILIVACEDESILGFAQFDPSQSAVDAIYVRPGHTRKGVGSRLLSYIEDVARSLKKEKMNITVSLNAVSFYENSRYIFQSKSFITCKDGTKFESVTLTKVLAAHSAINAQQ